MDLIYFMKLILGALAIAAASCIEFRVEHQKAEDYTSIPDWQNVCTKWGNNLCGINDIDCCNGKCDRTIFMHTCKGETISTYRLQQMYDWGKK